VKPLRSIRGRLQIWYGLMLVAVLTGFGVTAWQLERNRQLRNVDDQLARRLQAVVGALGRSGPRNRPGMLPRNPKLDQFPPDRVPPEPVEGNLKDRRPEDSDPDEFEPAGPRAGRPGPRPGPNEFTRMPPIGEFELRRPEAAIQTRRWAAFE